MLYTNFQQNPKNILANSTLSNYYYYYYQILITLLNKTGGSILYNGSWTFNSAVLACRGEHFLGL
jgi:hypothetical protein